MQYTVEQFPEFVEWHKSLALPFRIAVARRIENVQNGNFSDARSVGGGVSELRIHKGPGYRVYYTVRDRTVVFLLVGGDKSTQKADIEKAKKIAKEV
jgi:putative addiction module killer protein